MGQTFSDKNHSVDGSCFYLPDPKFDKVDERYTTNLITGVINAVSSPFSVLANVLIAFVIWRRPSLHTPSNVLLGSLAISDILVGLFVQPGYVAFRLLENRYKFVPCAVRMIYSTGFYLWFGVSFMTLSAISCERLIAILFPLRYHDIVRRSRVVSAAILIWFVNVFLAFLQWAVNDVARGIHLSLWLASLLISVSCQCRILPIIVRHQRQIHRLQQNTSPGQSATHMQVKLAINIACMVIIYFALNLPVLLVTKSHQILIIHMDSCNFHSWTETVASLNSSINPMICLWRVEGIRKAIIKLFPRNKQNMRDKNCDEIPRNDVALVRFVKRIAPDFSTL